MGGRGWVVALLLVACGAAPLTGQIDDAVLPSPRIVLAAGGLTADLAPPADAEGGHLLGARLDFPLANRVMLESSVERASIDAGESSVTRWQLEFGARLEWPLGRVRPFIGGGAGALLWPGDERPATADFVVATYGGMGGVRIDLTDRFDARGEVRRRWLDGLESSVTTFGVGLGWRF